ncbi:MAG: hypothetical protein ACYTBZ_31535 [Planctomycetota bacterium]|jgi:hypothetical protein
MKTSIIVVLVVLACLVFAGIHVSPEAYDKIIQGLIVANSDKIKAVEGRLDVVEARMEEMHPDPNEPITDPNEGK